MNNELRDLIATYVAVQRTEEEEQQRSFAAARRADAAAEMGRKVRDKIHAALRSADIGPNVGLVVGDAAVIIREDGDGGIDIIYAPAEKRP